MLSCKQVCYHVCKNVIMQANTLLGRQESYHESKHVIMFARILSCKQACYHVRMHVIVQASMLSCTQECYHASKHVIMSATMLSFIESKNVIMHGLHFIIFFLSTSVYLAFYLFSSSWRCPIRTSINPNNRKKVKSFVNHNLGC